MSKISELSDGGALQSTDYLIAVRSGGNVKVQPAGMTFSSVTITSSDINGGNIDGTVIGAATPAAGSFTTGQFGTSLNVDGTVTADGLTLANATFIRQNDSASGQPRVFGFNASNDMYMGPIDSYAGGAIFYGVSSGVSSQVLYTDAKQRLRISSDGDISFYEDTGTTPKFFWDASAESLGIGTTSPGAKLDVNGEVFISPNTAGKNTFQLTTNASNDARLKMLSDTTQTVDIQANGDSYFNGGNVGIGTSSPVSKLSAQTANITTGSTDFSTIGFASISSIGAANKIATMVAGYDSTAIFGTAIGFAYNGSGYDMMFATNNNTSGNPTEAMRIDSNQNLLVGTTTSAGKVTVDGAIVSQNSSQGAGNIQIQGYGATGYINHSGTGDLIFRLGTGFTERLRIDSSGNLFVGVFAQQGGGAHCIQAGSGVNALQMQNNGAAPYGPYINFSAATPNNTVNYFMACADSTATRAILRSNGGFANYQANDANLSDERVKTDIAPLGSMWDKFKALEIVTFKYKDQSHDDNNIGVIAQQVEAVAPEFVDNDGFGETPEGEEPLKAIYTADLYHAAIKALQEAMARIETLEAEVAALKGA